MIYMEYFPTYIFLFLTNENVFKFLKVSVFKSRALDFSFIANFDLHLVFQYYLVAVTTNILTLWAPNLEYSYLARYGVKYLAFRALASTAKFLVHLDIRSGIRYQVSD